MNLNIKKGTPIMFRKIALTTAAFAVIVGAGLTSNTQTADAKVNLNIGIGLGHGYYGGGYYGGYYAPRPIYTRSRCYRTRGHRVRIWSSRHGHWHKRWRRGRLICR